MEETLQDIIEKTLASYGCTGGINNIDGSNLPSKRAVDAICHDLLQLLFPGFHDERPLPSQEVAEITASRMRSMAERLKFEICKTMRISDENCPDARAQEVLLGLLSELPEVRRLLRTDVEAAYEGDPAAASYEEIILAYPFLETIAIQRIAHKLYARGLGLLARIMTEWAHNRTGIDIHPGAEIGEFFFIDHGTGVVIGETCRIGRWVKLYHGVTLGAKSLKKDAAGRIMKGGKRHPEVEDYVTIYPGSTVLGGDTVIGAGSTIGGNVFLMQSVPANSLVSYEETQLKIVPKRQKEQAVNV